VNLVEAGNYWNDFLSMLDNLLVVLYGMTGDPLFDYFLGTFLAALLAVIIGEFTVSVVYLVNKEHLERLNAKMAMHHNLSIAALKSGDKQEYQVQNKQANDAFGKVFFNSIALGAAYLWPCFFVLAWIQTRFVDLRIPVLFTDWTVNYVFVFLACYVLARILFNIMRPRLPYFNKVQKMLDGYGKSLSDPESFADLSPGKKI